jgi:kumamolisin
VSHRELQGAERQVAPGVRRIAAADPGERLSVSVRVCRRPDAPPLPDHDHWVVTPPAERVYLTREEFAERYGAAQADLDMVARVSATYGLAVVERSCARRTVVLSGSVAQMNRAFAVELGQYQSATGVYRGYEGSIGVARELGDVVEGVFGLDNRPVGARRNGPPGAAKLTPPRVARLYDFPSLDQVGGQTIGILEFGGGYRSADLQASIAGINQTEILNLPVPVPVDVPVDRVNNSPGNLYIDLEVTLDIVVAAAVAPGAGIAVYFAPLNEQGWVDAITTAVHDAVNQPSVLSISWGMAEFQTLRNWTWSWSAMLAVNDAFREAAALGVTVLAASGDDGSNDAVSDGWAWADFPGSSPWVTCCGGTILTNVSGSAFTEGTWNDYVYLRTGVTGGGISDVFDIPSWQAGASLPPSANPGNRRGRGVPDIAGNASPFSGYPILVEGGPQTASGTSAVAPLYAGLVALLNAKLAHSIGFLNPTLYQYAGSVCRDIADNIGDRTDRAPGYVSGPGWDACTGLGVVRGGALLDALRPAHSDPPVRLKDTKRFTSASNVTVHARKFPGAASPQVTFHYNDGSGIWRDEPMGFVIENNNFWQVAIVDAPRSAEFALRYDVLGQTFWDNNDGLNYQMGPSFYFNGFPAACTFVGRYVAMRSAELDWTAPAGFASGKIIVNDLGPSVLVGVRLTQDGWQSYRDVIATFEEYEQSGDCRSVVQRYGWREQVGIDPRSPPCITVDFAVFFFVGTTQYWDNNFRLNYRLSACNSQVVRIE